MQRRARDGERFEDMAALGCLASSVQRLLAKSRTRHLRRVRQQSRAQNPLTTATASSRSAPPQGAQRGKTLRVGLLAGFAVALDEPGHTPGSVLSTTPSLFRVLNCDKPVHPSSCPALTAVASFSQVRHHQRPSQRKAKNRQNNPEVSRHPPQLMRSVPGKEETERNGATGIPPACFGSHNSRWAVRTRCPLQRVRRSKWPEVTPHSR